MVRSPLTFLDDHLNLEVITLLTSYISATFSGALAQLLYNMQCVCNYNDAHNLQWWEQNCTVCVHMHASHVYTMPTTFSGGCEIALSGVQVPRIQKHQTVETQLT